MDQDSKHAGEFIMESLSLLPLSVLFLFTEVTHGNSFLCVIT
jgi:hypothetical protein